MASCTELPAEIHEAPEVTMHPGWPNGTPTGHASTCALTRSRPNGEACRLRMTTSLEAPEEPQG